MLTWIGLFFHVHCFDVLIQIAFLTELLQTLITLKLVFVVYSFYVHTQAFLAAKLLLALATLNWLTVHVANVRTQTVLVAELFQALIALLVCFNIDVNSHSSTFKSFFHIFRSMTNSPMGNYSSSHIRKVLNIRR